MHASLPRLLALVSSTALLLTACQQRSELVPVHAASVAAAQRVTLDPVTRLPVPTVTVGDTAAVSAPVSATVGPREATEVHLPDGTVGVRVDKRYFDTVTVCRQPDGSFSSACPAAKAVAKP